MKCFECDIEIEKEDAFCDHGLVLCMNCIEDYAYCKKCNVFTHIDRMVNYLCVNCQDKQNEDDMETYRDLFNLHYIFIEEWSKAGSILFQNEIIEKVKDACFYLKMFEEERAKKPIKNIQNISYI